MRRFRILPAILLLAALARAQEKSPQGPQELFDAFRRETAAAVEAERRGDDDARDAALARAATHFDLSQVTPAARDRVGLRAVNILYSLLEEKGWPKGLAILSDKPNAAVEVEPGRELICVRSESGRWRFGPPAIDLLDAWYPDLEDLAFKDHSTWLRSMMPEWLRHRSFLLANWQWLGLLALILLGFIVGQMSKAIFFGIAQRGAKARGVDLGKFKGTRRPFGLVALAAVWLIGLPILDLPARAFDILNLAARFVLMVGVVWSICRVVDWVAEVTSGMAQRTASKLDDLLVPMLRKAIKVFVVALGVVWIADNLGMDIAALVAGLGIGGIAIALASKDTVENFFGAISILADRPFQVGDWIVMGDIEGTVAEVGFRTTRVRTFYNSVITFPNASLIRNSVDNLGARQYRRIKMTIGVTYDTPADKLETFIEGIRELIRRHPYTRKDYYHVYFNDFGDSSLDILLYLFVATPDWATELRERHRLLMDILRLANETNVEFAFPTRTLHMVQGEVPDHEPPAPDLVDAWKKGQDAATGIVDRFTGDRRPPPVKIGQRPDEALADEDGE